MRQVWITRAGPPEVLQVREAPDPVPQPGEIRIRVEASGINFADLMARMGVYPDAPKIPCVVGYEIAGTVDRLGEGATGFEVGEPVVALTRFGGYADVVCVPVIAAYRRPSPMTAEVGAALLVNYLTAYQLLVVMGSLHQGDRVLIHSAAGGVGLAALDICRIHGAVTLGTAAASKHEFLRSRGLDHPIDSRSGDFTSEVRDITRGEGVEIVLDSVGGPNWRKNYRLLAPTGRLMAFGASSLASGSRRSVAAYLRVGLSLPRFTPLALMDANKGILGVNIGHLWDRPQLVRGWGEQLLTWFDEGRIDPRVDRTFPFAEAPDAHRYLHSRASVGKVLLVP
jgi:NADPH:quinone reductase-like Zn-dependent oxidoreductase